MARDDIRKGDLIYGGTAPEPAQVHMRKDAIKKGVFLTSTPRPSSAKNLAKQFPLMTDVIEAAGPGPGSLNFERDSAAIREIAARLRAVREALQAPRKRK